MNYLPEAELYARDDDHSYQAYDEISVSSDSSSSSSSESNIEQGDEDEYSGSIDSSGSSDSQEPITQFNHNQIKPENESNLLKPEINNLESKNFDRIFVGSNENEAKTKVSPLEDPLSNLNSSLELGFRLEQKTLTVFYGQVVIEPAQVIIEQSNDSPYDSADENNEEMIYDRNRDYLFESVHLDPYADLHYDTCVDPKEEPNPNDFYDFSCAGTRKLPEIGKINDKLIQIEEGLIESYRPESVDGTTAFILNQKIDELGEESVKCFEEKKDSVNNENVERLDELGDSDLKADHGKNTVQGTQEDFGDTYKNRNSGGANEPRYSLKDQVANRLSQGQHRKSYNGSATCRNCKIF